VARPPPELLSVDLVLKLVDRTKDFLVFLEELTEFFNELVDVFVDPVSVLELVNQTEAVNVRQVLLTDFVLLQVVEEHQHNAHDLLPAAVVQYLRYSLQDTK